MIRNLFFALVLVNLAFAAWTAWHAEPPRTSAAPRETGLPIRLVGEADPRPVQSGVARAANRSTEPAAERSATEAGGAASAAPSATQSATPAAVQSATPAAVQSAAPAAVQSAASGTPPAVQSAAAATPPVARSAGERCVSIGPFEDLEDAEAAAAALQAAGLAPAQRSAEGEIWVGFWVHLDAIPSREEANAMLAQLRDNGVPDAYLIPGEEDGDIISLGVFNNMTRAGRLDEQVRRVGLVPTILERSRPGTVHWLDVSVAGGADVDLGALGIGQARVGQQSCGAAG